MECVAADKVESVRVATPAVRATGAPRLEEPSTNWTVPVGLLPVTVAVKVTYWPTVAGLRDATTAVVVAAKTTSLRTAEVLVGLELSPLYTAVMKCVPGVNVDVVRVATPAARVTREPRLAAPSMNWTVPVGLFPVTVAVNCTGWPTITGFTDVAKVVKAGVLTLPGIISFSTGEELATLYVSPL